MKQFTGSQFALFRVVFGVYLCVHFIQLIPYAGEVFSGFGMLPNPSVNLTYGLLPNPLEHIRNPTFAISWVSVLALLAALFALGVQRRIVALLLWYGWACLFNRNNLISNPGLPYVGLLLLLCAIIPETEPYRFRGKPATKSFEMPAAAYWGAWFLLAAGYSYSGLWKSWSPSWVDGSALFHLGNNPLARPGAVRELWLSLPKECLAILTWATLAGEVLFLPLSLHSKGRLIAWSWLLVIHIGILFLIDFADLTIGMLMVHLFTFDPRWKGLVMRERVVHFGSKVLTISRSSLSSLMVASILERLKSLMLRP
jgi:hypothetical protein